MPRINFRPLVHADLPMLHEWMARPIANAGDIGKGLGTEMVKAFVARLFLDPAVTRVQADPDPRNARAIRCYEKAGFERVGEVTTPDGKALLMVCRRPRTSGA